MKVDWKHLATTPGYKSLKAAYIRDVQAAAKDIQRGRRPMRDKKEFLTQFKWVISRACHYAYHQRLPIESILNMWENNRKQWWFGYYQESNQRILHDKSCKPYGRKGLRKFYKHDFYSKDPVKRKKRMRDSIMFEQKQASVKSPKRWPTSRKKREAEIRNYRSKKSL